MKTLIKAIIAWLLSRLFEKPKSVEDKIKLDDHKCWKEWDEQLKRLENELAKLEEKAEKAGAHWEKHTTRSNNDKYTKLLERVAEKSAAIRRHNAHKPEKG